VSANIVYAILVTSLATFLSRFLGALTSEGIKETSKLFKWFNCLAYATLAALIARTIIFQLVFWQMLVITVDQLLCFYPCLFFLFLRKTLFILQFSQLFVWQ